MSLKLYCYKDCTEAKTCLFAASLSECLVEPVYVSKNEKAKLTIFPPEQSLQTLPTLVTGRETITQTLAILLYQEFIFLWVISFFTISEFPFKSPFHSKSFLSLCYIVANGKNKDFIPTPAILPNIIEWCSWYQTDFRLPMRALLLSKFGQVPPCPEAEKRAKTDIARCLTAIESRLAVNQYLCGSEQSIADVFLASMLRPLMANGLSRCEREHYPALTAWYKSIILSDKAVAVFGSKALSEVLGANTASDANKVQETAKQQPSSFDIKQCKFRLDEWKRVYSGDHSHAVSELLDKFDCSEFTALRCQKSEQSVEKANGVVDSVFAKLKPEKRSLFGAFGLYESENGCDIDGLIIFPKIDHHKSQFITEKLSCFNNSELNVAASESSIITSLLCGERAKRVKILK